MDKSNTTASRLKAIRGPNNPQGREVSKEERRLALRTAFIARFIVLREGRRSKAHRMIEEMVWSDSASADDVLKMFRQAFIANGDKMQPVEKDLQKAFKHAKRSAEYFIDQYLGRVTNSFSDALLDYSRSNSLLFSGESEESPGEGGWILPKNIY